MVDAGFVCLCLSLLEPIWITSLRIVIKDSTTSSKYRYKKNQSINKEAHMTLATLLKYILKVSNNYLLHRRI